MNWTSWNGPRITRNVLEACTRAVDKTGHVILTASQSQVPIDEKTLLGSGIVILKNESGVPIAIVSYGGGAGTGHPKVPYAIRWHEEQANFQHGRKWKYLKDPYNRLAGPALLRNLEQELRGVL